MQKASSAHFLDRKGTQAGRDDECAIALSIRWSNMRNTSIEGIPFFAPYDGRGPHRGCKSPSTTHLSKPSWFEHMERSNDMSPCSSRLSVCAAGAKAITWDNLLVRDAAVKAFEDEWCIKPYFEESGIDGRNQSRPTPILFTPF